MQSVTYHYLRNTCYLNPGIHPIDWFSFKSHLKYYKENYSILGLDENNFNLSSAYKNRLVLTFDDGLKEHLYASKLLKKENILGIFFIIGATIDPKKQKIPLIHKIHWLRSQVGDKIFKKEVEDNLKIRFSDKRSLQKKAREMHIHDNQETALLKYVLNFVIDYNTLDKLTTRIFKKYYGQNSESDFCKNYFLTMDEIKSINDMGHTIGWHSYNHCPMSKLSKDEINEDLCKGENFLKEINNNQNLHISYPYGRLDAIPVKYLSEIKNSNFKYGWTLGYQNDLIKKHNKYRNLLLGRITPNELKNLR